MRNSVVFSLCLGFVLSVVAIAPPAAGGAIGPRVGLTMGPDQVHGGLQFQAATITRQLEFQPSFDLGVGDNLIGVSANMDLRYVFAQGPERWRPYVGGGPAVFFTDTKHSDAQMDVGMNFLAGMQTPTRSGSFFGELRLGVIDSPDIKFTVGWMFR